MKLTPARVIVAERLVLVVGALMIVIAIAAFDWRAGLLTAGVLLVASVVEVPR